jgi:hypothetical protein
MMRFARGALLASMVAFWPLGAASQQMTPQPAATPTPSAFQYDAFDNKWHASITPYLWAPGISGQLQFRRPALIGVGLATIAVATGPTNYLGFFNFGALVAGEMRKNAFDVSADVIWLNLSHYGSSNVTITGPLGNVEIPVSTSVGWRLTTTMWELEPGVVFTHGTGGNGVFFAGVRSIGMTSAASWAFTGPIDLVPLTGSTSGSKTITDFITGLRGRVALGGRWFMPLYGDVGWGGQNTTNQWYAGIGHAERWGSLELFYRQLYYNDTSATPILHNLQLGGLALGATINL